MSRVTGQSPVEPWPEPCCNASGSPVFGCGLTRGREVKTVVRRSRKMCVVVPHHLGKGATSRPPLHPPGQALTVRDRVCASVRQGLERHRRGYRTPLWCRATSGCCITVQGSLQAPPKPPWPTPRRWIATGENSLSPRPHRAGRRCPALPLAAPFGQRAFAPPGPLDQDPEISLSA